MKKEFLYIIGLLVIGIPSCKQDKRREDAIKIVAEWTGKEIKFPQGLSCTSIGKDTTCVHLYNDNFKIVLYVDSTGCTSCNLKLSEWNTILRESDSVFTRKPEFVFFFHPKMKNGRELQFILHQYGFRHPVFIDIENEIGKINKFPSQPEYQCFLLDKDNKVIMVGNPSLNTAIWTLYKSEINERAKRVLTTEMKRAEKFFMANERTVLPPNIPLKGRKEAAKITN